MRNDVGVVHTVRMTDPALGRRLVKEGDSLRYAAMTALGVAQLPPLDGTFVLRGVSAPKFALDAATRAETSDDIGAVALSAWASAEAAQIFAASLFARCEARLSSKAPLETVACAWILIAAIAARELGRTEAIETAAAERLMEACGPVGLFPHLTPRAANTGLRANIGCFADQVYPIQALSRFSVARKDGAALSAAALCAAEICKRQGPDGQWWWHYDVRDGGVLDGYPVYSVHQHAMAPMALLDLRDAGGSAHWPSLVRGLAWLDLHPEVTEPLISHPHAVVWRKVARREPKKASRALSAALAAVRPGLRIRGLDAIFPPTRIDYECRPYELGWMLYAWLSGDAAGGAKREA